MLKTEFSLSKGIVMEYKTLITNPKYLHTFGSGFYWTIEVTVMPDLANRRSKCEIYYTVDGASCKYYLTEFYVRADENIETVINKTLEENLRYVSWHKVIEDIEKTANEAWDDID